MKAHVGASLPRYDGLHHATGTTVFVDDISLPGMLYVKVLKSPVHKGLIRRLDLTAALSVPGVVTALTARDVPGVNAYGLIPDQPVFASEAVRYRGERIAAVVAVDEDAAMEAVEQIDLEIEEHTPVFDPLKAMEPNAPQVRPEGNLWVFNSGTARVLRLGDIDCGFREADLILEGTYASGVNEHAPLEPQVSVAHIDEDGRLAIHTVSQAPHMHRSMLAAVFALPEERIRYLGGTIGGGFGSKNDIHCDHIAGLAALKTGRPVKYRHTRSEETLYSTKRGAWRLEFRDGIRRDGRITARQIRAIHECGAYAGMGPYVTEKAQIFCAGPYRIPNVAYDGYAVFTNKPISSSMRAFGSANVLTAVETQMNRLAEAIGMDPWEIRFINAWRDGDLGPTRYKVVAPGLIEAMKRTAAMAGYTLPSRLEDMTSAPLNNAEEPPPAAPVGDQAQPRIHHGEGKAPYGSNGQSRRDGCKRRGRGIAAGLCPVGMSGGGDVSNVEIRLSPAGVFEIRGGFVDLGQGAKTVLRQIAADGLGVDLECVGVAPVDTNISPTTTGTFSSRITLMEGNAVLRASSELKLRIREWAAARFSVAAETVQIEERSVAVLQSGGWRHLRFAEIASSFPPDRCLSASGTHRSPGGHGYDPQTGEMTSVVAMSFGACVADVEVDSETGLVSVLKITQALEVGRVINPLLSRGQGHGGMGFGIGFALTENAHPFYPSLDHAAAGYRDYLIPTATDFPAEVEQELLEVPHPNGPFGAKGFGEGLPTVITSPAIISAIHDAIGVWITEYPATPERILRGLEHERIQARGSGSSPVDH